MNKGILYSNGVVSSLSQGFLNFDFFNRLSECDSILTLQKLLEETSFNFSQDEMTITEKMQIEKNKLVDFVKAESPDDKFTKLFLLPFDYENIQTFCKCSVLNIDAKSYIVTEGYYSYDQIKSFITTKNYKGFGNIFIEKSLEEFDKLSLDKELSGWELELIFKKALYNNLTKDCSNVYLANLIKCEISIENLSVATRSKTQFEFESQLLDGGELSKNQLLQIFKKEKGFSSFNASDNLLPFLKIASGEKSPDNLVNFEREKQSFKANFFFKFKDNIETICPFAYYTYRKLNDIKNIQLAYSYVENGLNKHIKKRILQSEK